MATADRNARRLELKNLIIEECEKEFAAEDIADDELLFGNSSRLQLDSVDALQLSMALQHRYGIRLADSKELRKAFASVAALDEYLDKALG